MLDIGNTHIKYGYFDDNILLQAGTCTYWTDAQWNTFFKENPASSVLVGTVGATTKRLLAKFPKSIEVQFVDNTTKYPFTSSYDSIHSLGIDRRAALAGALTTHPNTPVFIIDAGSCITYDFMNENAHHVGGAISPGRSMRYHAMHLFTDKLPHLPLAEKIPTIGTSTQTSMELGVEAGIIAEIEAQIDAFFNAYSNFTTILTGGDANFLNKMIKNTIFADSNLTIKGLHSLLMFNSFHEK